MAEENIREMFKRIIKDVTAKWELEHPERSYKSLHNKIPKGEIFFRKDGTVEIKYEEE